MYLKINGEEKKYFVVLMPFKTQHGNDAIRFIGDQIPETNKGFKYYDEEGNVFSDLSAFRYMYKPNEYSVAEEEIEYGKGSDQPLPVSDSSTVMNMIDNLNKQVKEITPMVIKKPAYIDDTECIFEDLNLEGKRVDAFVETKDGEIVQCSITRDQNNIIVSFDPLEQVATVTLSIQ